jgi:hypothetical protein
MSDLPVFPPELMTGCRNLLINYGGIKEGDEVVILSELGTYIDPVVVQAQATVIEQQGAHAHILWTPRLQKTWWEDLSKTVRGAVGASDVVVQNIYTIGKTHLLDLMLNNGVRRIRNYASDVELMCSEWARFPVEVQDAIELKINTKLKATKHFRVTTADGSDFTGDVAERTAPWRKDVKRSGGMNITFPPGVFRASEAENCEGVMVVWSTYPWGARRVGLPEIRFENPVKLTIEKNHVIHFEGGWEADAYRKLFEEHVKTIGREAYKLDSFHCGSSPLAFTPFAPQMDPSRFDHLIHEHESWFHFHVGSLSNKATDRTQRAEHVNAVMQRPTVYLDGEKVWDNGHLLAWADPDMQELGRKYGDPTVMFAQRPIWWG